MYMKSVFTSIFFLVVAAHVNGQIRSLKDYRDYEFLRRKIFEVIKKLDKNQYSAPFDINKDDINMVMNFKRMDSVQLRKYLLQTGFEIVGLFYCRALRHFPELNTMTINSRANDNKMVTMTYQLFADTCIGFVNGAGKPVLAKYDLSAAKYE